MTRGYPDTRHALARDSVIGVTFTLALFAVVLGINASRAANEHDSLLERFSRVIEATQTVPRMNALEVQNSDLIEEVKALRTRVDQLEAAAAAQATQPENP